MGKGRFYPGEAFHFSGILKIIEIVLLLITIIIHRRGDNGNYLFFATAAEQIQYNSSDRVGLNMENVGNGFVVSFLIISPVLLLCYLLDGQEQVQQFFLEWIWNLVAACGFIALGAKSAMIWTAAKAGDDQAGTDDYARNYDAALTMAAFCILAGIVYFVDFVVAFAMRGRNRYSQTNADGY